MSPLIPENPEEHAFERFLAALQVTQVRKTVGRDALPDGSSRAVKSSFRLPASSLTQVPTRSKDFLVADQRCPDRASF